MPSSKCSTTFSPVHVPMGPELLFDWRTELVGNHTLSGKASDLWQCMVGSYGCIQSRSSSKPTLGILTAETKDVPSSTPGLIVPSVCWFGRRRGKPRLWQWTWVLYQRQYLAGGHGVTTLCSETSDFSFAEGNLGSVTKWTILENRSTTVKMLILPSELSSLVRNSIEMWDIWGQGKAVGDV